MASPQHAECPTAGVGKGGHEDKQGHHPFGSRKACERHGERAEQADPSQGENGGCGVAGPGARAPPPFRPAPENDRDGCHAVCGKPGERAPRPRRADHRKDPAPQGQQGNAAPLVEKCPGDFPQSHAQGGGHEHDEDLYAPQDAESNEAQKPKGHGDRRFEIPSSFRRRRLGRLGRVGRQPRRQIAQLAHRRLRPRGVPFPCLRALCPPARRDASSTRRASPQRA